MTNIIVEVSGPVDVASVRGLPDGAKVIVRSLRLPPEIGHQDAKARRSLRQVQGRLCWETSVEHDPTTTGHLGELSLPLSAADWDRLTLDEELEHDETKQ